MPLWTCYTCGGTVTGYEGERGQLVGVCPFCGRGYGGARGVEAPEPAPQDPEQTKHRHAMRYALMIGAKDKASWQVSDQYTSIEEAEQDAHILSRGRPWRIETRPYGCYQAFVHKDNQPEIVKEGGKE